MESPASWNSIRATSSAGAALDVARIEFQPHAAGGGFRQHGALGAGIQHHRGRRAVQTDIHQRNVVHHAQRDFRLRADAAIPADRALASDQ